MTNVSPLTWVKVNEELISGRDRLLFHDFDQQHLPVGQRSVGCPPPVVGIVLEAQGYVPLDLEFVERACGLEERNAHFDSCQKILVPLLCYSKSNGTNHSRVMKL
jgi:hypothetical protein